MGDGHLYTGDRPNPFESVRVGGALAKGFSGHTNSFRDWKQSFTCAQTKPTKCHATMLRRMRYICKGLDQGRSAALQLMSKNKLVEKVQGPNRNVTAGWTWYTNA